VGPVSGAEILGSASLAAGQLWERGSSFTKWCAIEIFDNSRTWALKHCFNKQATELGLEVFHKTIVKKLDK
jgi:hypothetical protein